MKRFLLPLLLVPGLAWGQVQDRSGASVMVTNVDTGNILAANNIDNPVGANMAGRLGFKLLVHEWVVINQIDVEAEMPGTQGMRIIDGMNAMLADGQQGEMARATLARLIGYTPQSLGDALQTLMREMGIETKDFAIQRSQYNGPEWTGTISLRDTGRIAVALTRLHGESINQSAAGAGLECFNYGVGPNTGIVMTSVVSGAASPEGCLAAARSAIELSDTRLNNHVMIEDDS